MNVVSVNAFFQPDSLVIDYGAAKAALLNVSKALSQELGPQGIRINSVSPGQVATDLWLGDEGVAATIGRASGVDPEAVRGRQSRGDSNRPVHNRRGGGDARGAARLASDRKRHGRELRDRRRTREDDVILEPGEVVECRRSSLSHHGRVEP